MSYQHRSYYKFILFITLLATGATFGQQASAAVKFSKCGPVIQWAAVAYEQDKNVRRKYNDKYLLSIFMDEVFKPTFGTTFDQLNDRDVQQFAVILKKCRETARMAAKAASKRGNGKATKFYNAAVASMAMTGIDKPASRVDSFSANMAHQKKVYGEHKKARIIKNKQLAKAKAMSASKANIQELAVMANEPQFVYLRPAVKKNHGIILHNRGVELADQMVEQAIAKFNDFPTTLKGLQDLQAFRQQLQKDLQGVKSSKWSAFDQSYMARTIAIAGQAADEAIDKLDDFSDGLEDLKKLTAYRQEIQNSLGQVRTVRWPDFEKAYGAALNRVAESAIGDFEENLNDLPANATGLSQAQNAVTGLFKYRPAPASLQSYRDIAKTRVHMIQQEIQKISCYKKLDSVGLDEDDRDVALLGYNGETTLGLFVCAITKRGHKFQEYEAAGWFGNTHTLSLLNQRGITLTIEMEEVEAVKGKEMLVGVLIKDASSETKLTLTGWQDYASRLVGARRY